MQNKFVEIKALIVKHINAIQLLNKQMNACLKNSLQSLMSIIYIRMIYYKFNDFNTSLFLLNAVSTK